MLRTGSPSSEITKLQIEECDNQVIVLVFYGTSCMGKTELVRLLREMSVVDSILVQDVSKDTIARPLMDAYSKEHPEILYEDIYMTILSQITKQFAEDAFRALSHLKPGKNIVVLDDAWADSKLIEKISETTIAPGYEKKVICVYPKVSEKRMYSDMPFSLQLIVNLIYRVMGRKEHETMIYEDVKKVQIVISFLRLYSNVVDIPSRFKEELPAFAFTPLEFHQEEDSTLDVNQLPQEVKEIFDQVTYCFENMGAPFEYPFVTGKEHFVKLTQMMDKLIEEQAHYKIPEFINYGRKAEWEKWYNRYIKNT